jgi:hypothetical protein
MSFSSETGLVRQIAGGMTVRTLFAVYANAVRLA